MSNPNGGKWIRPSKRRAIYERDGWECLWCRRAVGCRIDGVCDATLDHFQTRAKGGSNLSTNVFTSCLSCNSSRGDMSALAFARSIAPIYGVHDDVSLIVFATLERILEAIDNPVESAATLKRYAERN